MIQLPILFLGGYSTSQPTPESHEGDTLQNILTAPHHEATLFLQKKSRVTPSSIILMYPLHLIYGGKQQVLQQIIYVTSLDPPFQLPL